MSWIENNRNIVGFKLIFDQKNDKLQMIPLINLGVGRYHSHAIALDDTNNFEPVFIETHSNGFCFNNEADNKNSSVLVCSKKPKP